MKALESTNRETQLAKCLAPEDVQRGQFVAVLNINYEYPSYFWDNSPQILAPE